MRLLKKLAMPRFTQHKPIRAEKSPAAFFRAPSATYRTAPRSSCLSPDPAVHGSRGTTQRKIRHGLLSTCPFRAGENSSAPVPTTLRAHNTGTGVCAPSPKVYGFDSYSKHTPNSVAASASIFCMYSENSPTFIFDVETLRVIISPPGISTSSKIPYFFAKYKCH